ncbi:MAG TPA: glycosyltransferase [Vicinamibacterales bacterium]|nr:glycosyltransferase [Vicinamibacterales bacterium]
MTSGPRAVDHKAPRVDGKFLNVENRRFLVKGVTYGTFAPDGDGIQFPPPARVAQDFALMAAASVNTVRTYTVPPVGVLDAAIEHGLRVMVGLEWPQHIPFLDDPELVRRIRQGAVATVRRLASHPAALLFAVGNEIPPGIVRWHGARRIERFLRELYEEIKTAAPDSLLTYVNFPPTEYLDLDCFDVCSFNVYLHRDADLRAYLARLQHIAGHKPLLLAEAGCDSVREGLDGQARITAMHLRAAFTEGACGAVAYSWTDEWWRGGGPVNDWAFGLVDEARNPKPALAAVRNIFADAPFPASERAGWPKVSVVVCAYNAADTIDDCLTSLASLTYPSVEVIVVNDGSRDATGSIARGHPDVRVIDAPKGGLSAARNVGLAAATGEIVAYTDADVRVDADWLTYLVQPMLVADVAGAGGPNVVPHDDPWLAQCVARAPGGPTHVMLDDRIAEHVPGCNMAFRRDALLSIDGFNPVYLRAGDDVDICWRLQAKGLRVGFAPAALVWHHHRGSVRAFWRQQVGYGEAETWLDAHHSEKFLGGQMLWHGRIYSPLPFLRSAAGRRVNTGVWGTAAFPSIYSTQTHRWQFLPHSPLWMAASLVLLIAGITGELMGMDAPWLLLSTGETMEVNAPLLLLAAGLLGCTTTLGRCATFAWRSDLSGLPGIGRWSRAQSRPAYRALIAWLHLVQPVGRFRGNLRGLSLSQGVASQHVTRHPWKTPVPAFRDARAAARLLTGGGTERSFWSESHAFRTTLLTELVGVLRAARPAQVVHVDEGWRQDRDLSLTIGRWGWLHVQTLVEDHEKGSSLFRTRARLRPSFLATVQALTVALLVAAGTSVSIAFHGHSASMFVSIVGITAIAARAAWQATRAVAVVDRAVARVATAAGMLPLPLAPAPRVSHPAETTLSETTLSRG